MIKKQYVQKNLKHRYEEGKSLKDIFKVEKKKMIVGNLFRVGKVLLNHEILEIQTRKAMEEQEALAKKRQKYIQNFKTRKASSEEVLKLNKKPETLGVKQLRAFVIFKKRDGDGRIPTMKSLLISHYKATYQRHDIALESIWDSLWLM